MCRNGNHKLINIIHADLGYDEGLSVEWCKTCGAVVVDGDFDGRTRSGHHMKMQFPEITWEFYKNESLHLG